MLFFFSHLHICSLSLCENKNFGIPCLGTMIRVDLLYPFRRKPLTLRMTLIQASHSSPDPQQKLMESKWILVPSHLLHDFQLTDCEANIFYNLKRKGPTVLWECILCKQLINGWLILKTFVFLMPKVQFCPLSYSWCFFSSVIYTQTQFDVVPWPCQDAEQCSLWWTVCLIPHFDKKKCLSSTSQHPPPHLDTQCDLFPWQQVTSLCAPFSRSGEGSGMTYATPVLKRFFQQPRAVQVSFNRHQGWLLWLLLRTDVLQHCASIKNFHFRLLFINLPLRVENIEK